MNRFCDIRRIYARDGTQGILIPDILLWSNQTLIACYKEIQGKGKWLGNVPVLVLPNLSLYQRDPLLKKALWQQIQALLSTKT